MNVVEFPRAARVHPAADATPELLGFVVGALQVLGEPATIDEMSTLLRGVVPPAMDASPDAVAAIVRAFDDGARWSIFREVRLGDGPAYALTPSFRADLAQRGVFSALR